MLENLRYRKTEEPINYIIDEQQEEPKEEPITNIIDEQPSEAKEEPTTKVIKPKKCFMSHVKNLSTYYWKYIFLIICPDLQQ